MDSAVSELDRLSKECLTKVGPALEGAAEIAAALRLEPVAEVLRQKNADLKNDRFTVLVFGRFRGGKSTFLNALLGKPLHPIPGLPPGAGPLPTGVNPTTARVTRLYYAEQPQVRVVKKGGKREEWSFQKFSAESIQSPSARETEDRLHDVEAFEIGYPTPFCKGHVDLYDAPGTDDSAQMDFETLELASRADAAVLFLKHPAPLSMGEKKYLKELESGGLTSYLTVVNAYDLPEAKAMPPTEETRANIWDRLVTQYRGREPYRGQALETEDIYILNALQAFQGRMDANAAAVRDSGIEKFEERLASYLSGSPHFIHLKRHLAAVENKFEDILEEIRKQRMVLQVDCASFEAKLAAIQRELAEIPLQAQRFPSIVEHYRAMAADEISQGMESLVASIEKCLPEYMSTQKLPSLHKKGFLKYLTAQTKAAIGMQKQLCEEANTIVQEFINQRVQGWMSASTDQAGAARIVATHFENMKKDLQREAIRIEKRYADLQVELTGYKQLQPGLAESPVSLANRVVSIAAAVFLRDPTLLLFGATGGWKEAAKGFGLQLAVLVPLLVVGLTPPVAITIAVAASLVRWGMGMQSIERNIIDITVEKYVKGYPADIKKGTPGFAGIREECRRMREPILASVNGLFNKLADEIQKETQARIQAEESSIQNQHETVKKNAVERDKTTQLLTDYEARINGYIAAIRAAVVAASRGLAPSSPAPAAS